MSQASQYAIKAMSNPMITFRASHAFWSLLEDKSPPQRRVLLSNMLLEWDGEVREFPLDWRGQSQELSVHLTTDLSRVLDAIKERDIARTVALFSAAIQYGLTNARRDSAVEESVAQTATQATTMGEQATPAPTTAEHAPVDAAKAAVSAKAPKKSEKSEKPEKPKKPKAGNFPASAAPPSISTAPPKKRQETRDRKAAPPALPTSGITPGITPGCAPDIDMSQMSQMGVSPEEGAILFGKVRALRSQAIDALRAHKAYVFDVASITGGNSGDEADRAEAAASLLAQSMALDRARRQLVEADDALKRMRESRYGWCEETGEPIGFPRLLAQPFAKLSLEAQERMESKLRTLGFAYS